MSAWTADGLGAIAGPGQRLYALTMVTGLALAMLVALQIALALYARRRLDRAATAEGRASETRSPDARETRVARALEARQAHRLLGRALLVLVIVHPLFYLTAATRRIGHFAPAKLWHSFSDGSYYGHSLLLGLVGVGAVVAFAGAAALSRRVPPWHGLVRLGVLLGGWHALRIGSHVREGVAGGMLRVGLAVMIVEGMWRLARGARRHLQSRSPSQATPSAFLAERLARR